jgi:DNA-binding transcriptional regulator YhcF (GntR family)
LLPFRATCKIRFEMVKRAAAVESPLVRLDTGAKRPLYRQVAEQLRQLLTRGVVPTGTRLPASRALARSLGVSRNTVLAAYDELAAEGIVCGRVGAGSYVASRPRVLRFRDPDGNQLVGVSSRAAR